MYTISATTKGVHRWVPVKAPLAKAPGSAIRISKTVYVIDNGGTSFHVDLTSLRGPGTAHIYINNIGDNYDVYDEPGFNTHDRKHFDLWKSYKYEKAFVGLDPEEKPKAKKQPNLVQRLLGDGKVWWHGGNSVLLKVRGSTHIYIGSEIFSFNAVNDDIVEYWSPMGNSAVPYPYAVGKENTYLMLERCSIKNSDLNPDLFHDPYDQYYGHNIVKQNTKSKPPPSTKLVSLKTLQSRL
jgi:hypothetical protein